MMWGAGRKLAWRTWRGWPLLAVVCVLGAAAGAHKAGTTGYATITVAGQTVTILVEGFHPHSVSPFTLTAELVP